MELQYNQTENTEKQKSYRSIFSRWLQYSAGNLKINLTHSSSRSTIQPTGNKIKVGKPQAKVLLIPKAP